MELFREGGPFKVRRTGPNEHEVSVPVPLDEAGMFGRTCPNEECAPGYFKVKAGTGVLGPHDGFCPYCGQRSASAEFHTKDQWRYAKEVAVEEAVDGLGHIVKDKLRLGSDGRRTIGGGLVSFDLSLTGGSRSPVQHPREEVLRRDVICDGCGLAHAVFGLAVWCPDCGKDIFVAHVKEEFETVRRIVGDVGEREKRLGVRVAVRDLENALEDVVSILECSLKALIRRGLCERVGDADAEKSVSAMGNACQNLARAEKEVREKLSIELFEGIEDERLARNQVVFEKRHPITHNLGIVDPKFLRRVRSGGSLGREVWVNSDEVLEAVRLVEDLVVNLQSRLFATQDNSSAEPLAKSPEQKKVELL